VHPACAFLRMPKQPFSPQGQRNREAPLSRFAPARNRFTHEYLLWLRSITGHMRSGDLHDSNQYDVSRYQ
jgi:hypothetical protein